MSDQGGTYRDMLDIIFADRNRAYGAYFLRRNYQSYLTKAIVYGVGLVILFFI